MNAPATTREKVAQIVHEHLAVPVDEIKADASFESMDGDSLDQVEIVMTVEDEFGVEIPDEEAETLTSVDAICAWLDKHPGHH